VLRAVIKRSYPTEDVDESIRHRLIPDDAVKSTYKRLEEVKEEVSEVLKEEVEKEARREFPSHQVAILMSYRMIRSDKSKWRSRKARI
jgi:hypothetical protein